MPQNKSKSFFSISGVTVVLFFFLIGIVLVASTLLISTNFINIPSSIVLNENTSFLTVEDVWSVDNEFSVWINNVEEINGATAKEIYPELEDITNKRYFDVTFSFQNINFPGCKINDKVHDYLTIKTTAIALNGDKSPVWPTSVKTYCQESYAISLANEHDTPVTRDTVSFNNHMLIEIDSQSKKLEDTKYFAIRFVVPVEILSAEASVQYRQDFIYSIP